MDGVYVKKIYFGIAIDPIHIGTGGYTLGRADNPILRDFDGVPKIPGTSIEGTARTYAYFQGQALKKECAKGNKDACGHCNVCVSFGYTGEERSQQGLAIFSDARVLFFSLSSLVGPVWVTSPSKLKELGVREDGSVWESFDKSESCIPSSYLKDKLQNVGYLNFGWLLLQLEKRGNQLAAHNISVNTVFGEDELPFERRGLDKKDIFNRLVIVSDSVLSQIVNSNLEVRTSVSINPETGAAEEHALFTYEAIPRGTILQFSVVYQDPKHFDIAGRNLGEVISTIETSLELFEFLGVGGMGTRGFGKLKVFGLDKRYDPITMAQVKIDNMQKRLEEIDKVKNVSSEVRAKLEQEKQEILEEIRQTGEKYAKLAEIYREAKGG
jgi:CRISPR-associated protein Cmr4